MSAPQFADGATVYGTLPYELPRDGTGFGIGTRAEVIESYPDEKYQTFYLLRVAGGAKRYAYERELSAVYVEPPLSE